MPTHHTKNSAKAQEGPLPLRGRLWRKFRCAPAAVMCTEGSVSLEPAICDIPYPSVLASQPESTHTNARHHTLRFCNMQESMHALVALLLPDHTAQLSGACECQDVPLAHSGCPCCTLPNACRGSILQRTASSVRVACREIRRFSGDPVQHHFRDRSNFTFLGKFPLSLSKCTLPDKPGGAGGD